MLLSVIYKLQKVGNIATVSLCSLFFSFVRPSSGLGVGVRTGHHFCSRQSGFHETMSKRVSSVPGLNNQVNDIVYHGPLPESLTLPPHHVLYFGGDVQDYLENMESWKPHEQHIQWNLESTTSLLHQYFPTAFIWVIKPSRMHLKSFAVYSHFVESNDFGCPTHFKGQTSLSHLMELFQNSRSIVAEMLDCAEKQNEEQTYLSSSNNGNSYCAGKNGETLKSCLKSTEFTLSLMGFSKGCVVLNQMLYDMLHAFESSQQEVLEFLLHVTDIYWLDGGHSGGSNTWVTDKDVLGYLAKSSINVHAHVTPYQVRDEMRKWIGKEQAKFVKELKKLGKSVHNVIHFEDEPRSLENHFKVLNVFRGT